jgi:hypothetical protein
MKKKIKILMSARDPGAINNIIALFRMMSQDNVFSPLIVASGAASAKLNRLGMDHIVFCLDDGTDHITEARNSSSLIVKAANLLDQTRPDMVLASISSLGAGIDEALIHQARVPVFALQDFWGDVNMRLGKTANLYFVLDQYAADLSYERWGVLSQITGMPKYKAYESFVFQDFKKKTRDLLKVLPDEKLIGWFGQPKDVPGYSKNMNTFLSACARLPKNYTVVIKPHPKSKLKDIPSSGQAGDFKPSLKLFPDGLPAEDLLVACDLVVTSFSLCGLDHAVMSSYCQVPLGNVMYLMSNSEIRDFAIESCGMDRLPTVEKYGAGFWIDICDSRQIAEEMDRLMLMEERKSYAARCKDFVSRFDYLAFKKVLQKS